MTLQKKDAADGRRSDAGSASANFQLESQIGERVTFLDKMARMVRENRLAAFSALLILLFILAAVFAPVLTPYGYTDMDLMHRLSAPTAASSAAASAGDTLKVASVAWPISMEISVWPAASPWVISL